MTDPRIELSSVGELRKKSILAMAKVQASRRRRRRKAMRALAAAIVLALLVSALHFRLHRLQTLPTAAVPIVDSRTDQQIAKTTSKSRVLVSRIKTDPRIIERLAIPSQTPRWKKIDDDELLRDLASAHRPAGLAYIGGKPVLLFRSPADSISG